MAGPVVLRACGVGRCSSLAAAVAAAELTVPGSAARRTARALHTSSASQGFRRKKETGKRLMNPSDPNYVPPETDARTQSIVDLTFPLTPQEPNKLTEDPFAKRMAEAEAKLPYGSEVHTTIVRAWLAHQREKRQALEADLRTKYAAMADACDDLASHFPHLHQAAKQRARPNDRSPAEVERLKKYGLTPGAQLLPESEWSETTKENAHRLRPIWASPSARLKVVQQGGRRLSGLFPREWRPPTHTPRREGWPAYYDPDQF